jgi:hypothetical protein
MSFLDALLGRTQPRKPNLDTFFALPSAAITLEAGAGLRPSGRAAVCFKPASGQRFAGLRKELEDLLRLSAQQSQTQVSEHDDDYGYHWLMLRDPELPDVVGATHLVSATLQDRGFGPQLLCSLFGFEHESSGAVFLVYLYKRGTFYPFAPRAGQRRDNELELRVRALLGQELPIEPDLGRWFPLWGVPTA